MPEVDIWRPTSRWKQDSEVAELIEYFNHPSRFRNWDAITNSEFATIVKESDRCRNDFVYAARNYFWITTKKREEQLLTLNEAQELILQKVLEIKAKGLPQKVIIIKGRQLGCSTLIEALIAWRTMFFQGVNSLVVCSDTKSTSQVIFPIMLFIYDRMPWWLQPMCASRKIEEGLYFDNPDASARALYPGLNSRVYVRGANTSGVGEGIRLSAVHFSEFAGVADDICNEIIDEDMTNALVEDEGTFAILESTAKGANKYPHKLWKKCVELADEAEWYPLFLPAFFERTRVRPVTVDFHIESEDARMRERVFSEWTRCDNPSCLQYHLRFKKQEDRTGQACPTCNTGKIHAYMMPDEQLAWFQHRRRNAARDDESMKRLRQEMCVTSEEAWQISGLQVFGDKAQQFANDCVRPPIAEGNLDKSGKFHGCNYKNKRTDGTVPCFQEDCTANHEWDEKPMKIWEFPQPGATYAIGADVAEGLGGKSCYSVASVIRVNQFGGRDYQAAVWRSNTADPISFGYKLNFLGLYYNECQVAPEVNKYDTCLNVLRQLSYPNLYRWKHVDSMNMLSNKLGWWTNVSSRPRLWQTFRSWLNQELFLVKSHNLAEEMKNFVKDDDESISAGGDQDEFDDELMATMIALYTAHESDWNDNLQMIQPRNEMTIETSPFVGECVNCKHKWPMLAIDDAPNMMDGKRVFNPGPMDFEPVLDNNKRVAASGGVRCPGCGSRIVTISRNQRPVVTTYEDELLRDATSGVMWSPDDEFRKAMDYDLI